MSDNRQQDFAALAAALLDQAFNRDIRIAHRGRNLGQNAGLVAHCETDVITPDPAPWIRCWQGLERMGCQ